MSTREAEIEIDLKDSQDLVSGGHAAGISPVLLQNEFFMARIGNSDPAFKIDSKLFAHINNDYTLSGSYLQGDTLSRTPRYLAGIIKRIHSGEIHTILSETERQDLEKVTAHFETIAELEDIIKQAVEKGKTVVKGSGALSDKKTEYELEQIISDTVNIIWNRFQSSPEKEMPVPGGVRQKPSGHAMVYNYKRLKNADGKDAIEFTVYNTGGGLDMHPESALRYKTKYSPLLICMLDGEDVYKQAKELMRALLLPMMEPHWNEKRFDGHKLYQIIFKHAPNILDVELCRLIAVTGQRSGTCAWKVLLAILKQRLAHNLYLYRCVKLEIKFQSIVEDYQTIANNDQILQFEARQNLEHALRKINRLIEKIIKMEKKQGKPDSEKRYAPYCKVLSDIQQHLNKAKMPTITKQQLPDLKTMKDFAVDETAQYNKAVVCVDVKPASMQEMTLLEQECLKEKPEFGEFCFPIKFKYLSPIEDFKKLERRLVVLKNNLLENDFAILQTIEYFMHHLPLTGEKAKRYWAMFKGNDKNIQEQRFIFLDNLAKLQRLYIFSNRHVSYITPARVSTQTAFLVLIQFMTKYHYNNKFHAKVQDFDPVTQARIAMGFYCDFACDSARMQELKVFSSELASDDYTNSRPKEKLSFKQLAHLHNLNKDSIEKEVDIKAIIEKINVKVGAKKLSIEVTVNSLKEAEEILIFELYQQRVQYESFFKKYPALEDDLNFYVLARCALEDNGQLSSKIHENYPSDFDCALIFKDATIDYDLNVDEEQNVDGFVTYNVAPKSLENYQYERRRSKAELQYKNYFINHFLPFSIFEELYNFFNKEPKDRKQRHISLHDEYHVQVLTHVNGNTTLTEEADDERAILSMRLYPETRFTSTIDYFLNHLDKLQSTFFRYLLKINLQNQDIFRSALLENSESANSLLLLIERGLSYFDVGTIQTATPLLLSINITLLEEVAEVLKFKSGIKLEREDIEIFKNIQKQDEIVFAKINMLLLKNKYKIDLLEGAEKTHIILIQRDLHVLRLQKCIYLFTYKEERIDPVILSEYLESIFFIENAKNLALHDADILHPDKQCIKDRAQYLMANHVLEYLEKLMCDAQHSSDYSAFYQYIRNINPEIGRLFSEQDLKKCQFKYPILFYQNANENFVINFLTGNTLKGGLNKRYLPQWYYNSNLCKALFGSDVREGFVSLTEETIILTHQGTRYRVQKTGEIYKEIDCKGNKAWYQYQYNNRDNILFRFLPKHLTDNEHTHWASTTKDNNGYVKVFIADRKTAVNTYVLLEDRKIYRFAGNQPCEELVKLYHHDRDASMQTQLDFLKSFEGAQFIEVLKDPLRFYLPRYNVSFEERDGQLEWVEDRRYVLDLNIKPAVLPNFRSALSLKAKNDLTEMLPNLVLIPFQPYISTGQYSIDLDKQGLFMEDYLAISREEQGHSQALSAARQKLTTPFADHDFESYDWSVAKSCTYLVVKRDVNNTIIGMNAQDDLYLAYLSIVREPDAAFKALDRFQKAGGLAGTRREAQTLRFLLQESIPYQLKSQWMKKTKKVTIGFWQSENIITNAKITALQAKLLLELVKFLSLQNKFNLNSNQTSLNAEFEQFETKQLTAMLQAIPVTIQRVLKMYFRDKNSIPLRMRLRPEEEYRLLQFIKNNGSLNVPLKNRMKRLQKKLYSSLATSRTPLIASYTRIKRDAIAIPYDIENLVLDDDISRTFSGLNLKTKSLYLYDLTLSISDDDFIASVSTFYFNLKELFKDSTSNKSISQKIQEAKNILEQKVRGELVFRQAIGNNYVVADHKKSDVVFSLCKLLLYVIDNPRPFLDKRLAAIIPESNLRTVDKFFREYVPGSTLTIENVSTYQLCEVVSEVDDRAVVQTTWHTLQAVQHEEIEKYLIPSKAELVSVEVREALSDTLFEAIKTEEDYLKKLESELVDLANKAPTEPAKQLLRNLRLSGEKSHYLNIADIVALFSNADFKEYVEKTHLDEKDIQQLFALTTQYLLHQTLSQKFARDMVELNILIKLGRKTSATQEEFAKQLDVTFNSFQAKRCYHYWEDKNYRLLAYEFYGNILIRPTQTQPISSLLQKKSDQGKFSNKIIRLPMGGGKSKVLLPVSAYCKADSNNLIMIMVLDDVVKTAYADLKKTFKQNLGRDVICFTFDRYTLTGDLVKDTEILDQIIASFNMAIKNKDIIVSTPNSNGALQGVWLELFRNNDPKNDILIEKFDKILDILENQTDVFWEEVDDSLNIETELNFSFEDEEPLELSVRKHALILYRLFSEVQFKLKPLSETSYTLNDILYGKLPIFPVKEWGNLYNHSIVPGLSSAVVKHLATDPMFAVENLDTERLDEIEMYLSGQASERPAIIEKMNFYQKEVLTFYKEEISGAKTLHLTLQMQANVDFGYTRLAVDENERLIPIPYKKGQPKEKSKFASVFDTLNCTIQYNKLQGVEFSVIKRFLHEFKAKVDAERLNDCTIDPKDTQAAILFKKLTNLDLFDINLDNPSAVAKFFEDYYLNDGIIDFCLEHYILPDIMINKTTLRINRINQPEMFRSNQGITGTVPFPYQFSDLFELDDDTQKTHEEVRRTLLEQNTKVHAINFNSKKMDSFDGFLQTHHNTRAIIDVGLYFATKSNLEVARKFANFYKDKNRRTDIMSPKIKCILFYNEHDDLCALSVDDPMLVIPVKTTDYERMKEILGCGPDQWFTNYDKRHCRQVDIRHMSGSNAIMTFNGQITADEFDQARKRMRANEPVTVFVDETSENDQSDEVSKTQWHIEQIIEITESNQKLKENQVNYKTAFAKLHNVIRRDFIKRLRLSTVDIALKRIWATQFNKFFFDSTSLSLYDSCSLVAKERWADEILFDYKIQLFDRWKSIMQDAKIDITKEDGDNIQTTLDSTYAKAKKYCQFKTKTGLNTQNQQVQQQREQKRQQQIQALNEAQQEKQNLKLPPPPITPSKFKHYSVYDLLTFLPETFKDEFTKKDAIKFYPMQNFLDSAVGASGEITAPRIDPFIFVSDNMHRTHEEQDHNSHFNAFTFSSQYILFIDDRQKGGTLRAILLTKEEALRWQGFIKSAKNNADESSEVRKMWIMTPTTQFFVKAHPKIVMDAECVKLLEQICYCNGNANLLWQNYDKLQWLKGDKNKVDFYFKYIAPSFPASQRAMDLFAKRLALDANLKASVTTKATLVVGPLSSKSSDKKEREDSPKATSVSTDNSTAMDLDSLSSHERSDHMSVSPALGFSSAATALGLGQSKTSKEPQQAKPIDKNAHSMSISSVANSSSGSTATQPELGSAKKKKKNKKVKKK